MIEIKNLSKSFEYGGRSIDALRDVSITIEDGDIYGIIGMSGAGKSTLVRCINMLERPDSGSVIVDGLDMGALSPAELRLARQGMAMIFQQFNLLMQRNCLRNVCFPLELAGFSAARVKERAMELLELVGLPDKAEAYPAQLSGGQQQRVAIARALAMEPKVLLCDEATSALDPSTTAQILGLIKEINERLGISVVVITHQMSVVQEICNKVAILDDGRLAESGLVSEVFAAPRSKAGRRLVFPGTGHPVASDPASERKLRVVFMDAATTSRPLVATLAAELGIYANVIYADTQSMRGDTFGNMLLGIPNRSFARAVAWLRAMPNLSVEELDSDVQ